MKRLVINKIKLNINLSTLNFILCFIGFQLATSLFLPSSSNVEGISRSVSVPYRIFALLLSLFVFLLNVKRTPRTYPNVLIAFLVFWGILVVRIIFDVFIRTDIRIDGTSQIWNYIFGICLPAYLSIIKSYEYIDLEKSFWWILVLTSLTLIMTLFTNQLLLVGADQANSRIGANVAISTISFGHFGTTVIILGLYTFFNRKSNFLIKIILVVLIMLGVFCMLRAGSRGPILALVIIIFIWLFSLGKSISRSLIILFTSIISTIIFVNQILILIGQISPLIEDRLRLSIYGGSTGGRDPYYRGAINNFFQSPIWGEQFVVIFPDGSYDYSHNIILDALMGLGVIGGGLMIYFLLIAIKKSYLLINNRNRHYWICLLLVQQIMTNMVSGAFYYNPLLSVLLVFIFLKYRGDYKNDNFNTSFV